MLKSFSPKENDLLSCFKRAQHHGKCSRQSRSQSTLVRSLSASTRTLSSRPDALQCRSGEICFCSCPCLRSTTNRVAHPFHSPIVKSGVPGQLVGWGAKGWGIARKRDRSRRCAAGACPPALKRDSCRPKCPVLRPDLPCVRPPQREPHHQCWPIESACSYAVCGVGTKPTTPRAFPMMLWPPEAAEKVVFFRGKRLQHFCPGVHLHGKCFSAS
jgi:hypothetical protein